MANTRDIARSMAAMPLPEREEPVVVEVENNPLLLGPGFGLPLFAMPKASDLAPYTNPKTHVITTNVADVQIPILAVPGAVLRCRIQRKASPVTHQGVTGHSIETIIKWPEERFRYSAIEATTPEANSSLAVWTYHLVGAAEKWAESIATSPNGADKSATTQLPRLVKFVAANTANA